jgi:alcohol dehydrogenase
MIEVSALVARPGSRHEIGSMEFINTLELEDVRLDAPTEGEVLVEVMAAGLCHSDVSVLTGDRPRGLPMVLGHEAAGVVRDVGSGVRRVAPGDSVILTFVPSCGSCDACRSGAPALCRPGNDANRRGTLLTGRRPFSTPTGGSLNQHLGVSGFSRWTVVAEESLVPVRTNVDFAELAVLGCAVLTGVGAVLNTASVREGESVAVFGCGGVGLAAIMGARVAGASPIIGVDVVPERLERAALLGADHTIRSHDGVAAEIRDLTGGGASCSIEAAGLPQTLIIAYESTGSGGQTVIVGLANPRTELRISPSDLVATGRRIVGSYMGSAVPRRDVPRFLALFEGGRLPLGELVGTRHRLEDVSIALRAIREEGSGRQVFDLRPETFDSAGTGRAER